MQEGAFVLFLTNDKKEDWWVLKGEENNKETVGLRQELHREYLDLVGNDRIEFMTLPIFYELFSDYYEICDIKTSLELEIDSFVNRQIFYSYNLCFIRQMEVHTQQQLFVIR